MKSPILLSIVVFSSILAYGQRVDFPNKPILREVKMDKYKAAIKIPNDWPLAAPERNEILSASGELRGTAGIVWVRLSTVEGLHLTSPKNFVAEITKEKFLQSIKLGMPDVEILAFDELKLGGLPARRVIYTGTDSGIKTATLMYQTLRGDSIFTVLCICEAQNYHILLNDFELIADSFRFLPD